MVENYEQRLNEGFGAVLREASEFFMGQGDVYRTLQRLADRLDREQIPYALPGGLALAQRGFVRNRLRDLADVQDLIEMLQLPLDLVGELDSSVR